MPTVPAADASPAAATTTTHDATWHDALVTRSRVQAIVNELQGEKIDIVSWNEVKSIYVQHAISPAQVAKVNEFENSNRVEIVLPEDQLSIAIGRRGQNVKLASILTGLEIIS